MRDAALGPDIQKSWQVHELSDPYSVKFEVEDRKKRYGSGPEHLPRVLPDYVAA